MNIIIMSGSIVSGAEYVLLDYLKKSNKQFILFTSLQIQKSDLFQLKNTKVIGSKYLSNLNSSKSYKNIIKKIIYIFMFKRKLNKFILENSVTNIILNNTGDLLYLNFFKKYKNIKIYSIIHDILNKNGIYSKIIRYNQNKISKVITVSNACKKNIKNIGVAENKIQIIYNGLELEQQYKKKINTNKIIFLYVGALSERKNPIEFLEFLEKVKNKNLKINIEGRIIYKYYEREILESVKNKIKKLDIEINLLYDYSREKIKEEYKSANFLFVCSKKDPLPTVILEGFNNGLPAIGKDIDGIPEMIKNNYNGYLYSSNDDLNEIINKIFNLKQSEYELLSENSFKTMKKNFNIKTKVMKLDEIFEEKKHENNNS